MLGALILLALFISILWMGMNNVRDSAGLPKVHIHRYVPSWGNYNVEVCKYRNCKKYRLR